MYQSKEDLKNKPLTIENHQYQSGLTTSMQNMLGRYEQVTDPWLAISFTVQVLKVGYLMYLSK